MSYLEGGGGKLVSFPNFMPSNVGAMVFGGLVCGHWSLPLGKLRLGIDYLVIICFPSVGLVGDGIWFSWWWRSLFGSGRFLCASL